MRPFAEFQPGLRPLPAPRTLTRPLVFLLVLCLVAGAGVVAWRARARHDAARTAAVTKARAAGFALELQLGQTTAAAEVLGGMAKQGKGGLASFQQVANELLAAHPGLGSLDLEPGGVVRDIVPRAGYERVLGFNVLKDVAQGAGAKEAIARRVTILSGPVALYHREPGIVARVPLFQRASDGRESFWGFVAASMPLGQAAARAQLDQLPREGYAFALYAPTSNPGTPIVISSHGWSSFRDCVQQPIRVQNLELRLALKPRGGWIDVTKVVVESLAVLLIVLVVWLLATLVEGRRVVEAELKEVTQRLTRERGERSQALTDRTKMEEKLSLTQAALNKAQLALEEAGSEVAKLRGLVDAITRERDQTVQTIQAEKQEAHTALVNARETIAELDARLSVAAQAESRATSEMKEQLKQDQAAIAELQVQLEEARRSARDTAEANAATVAELERSRRESEERLLAAERVEARVRELEDLLRKTQEELLLQRCASSTGSITPPLGSASKTSCAATDERPKELPPMNLADAPGAVPGLSPVAESSQTLTTETPPPVSRPQDGLSSVDLVALAPSHGALETTSETRPVTEPSVMRRRSSKLAGRRQARRDDQMDLFESESAMPHAGDQPAAKVAAPPLDPKEPNIQEIADAAATGTACSDPAADSDGTEGRQEILERSPKPAGPTSAPMLQPAPPPMEAQASGDSMPGRFPVVSGLATSDGLANADSDPQRYLKALQHFARDHSGAPEKIRDGLVEGDASRVQQLLETLQQAANSIAATDVHRAATALAHACRVEMDPGEVESLWAELEKVLRELLVGLETVVPAKEEKSAPVHRPPTARPVDLPQLRKAVNQILPLLVDRDPGARDCLKDQRSTFRSAFAPESYAEFERLVKTSAFEPALEQLKKAVRKHGIAI